MPETLPLSPAQLCDKPGCTETRSYQWLRRASDEEWQQHVDLAHEQQRQLAADYSLANREAPHPDVFVPADGASWRIVGACKDHSPHKDGELDYELMSKLHQANCVPPCACTELKASI